MPGLLLRSLTLWMKAVSMMSDYQVFVHKGNGYVARIHKPILSEKEYKLRELEVRKALNEFGKEIYKGKGVN